MKTILVIYDDDLTSEVIKRTLQKDGYKIEKMQMSDLSLNKHPNPDIIIIEFPQKIEAGINLVKMIKKNEPSIKILITSAHQQSDIDKIKKGLVDLETDPNIKIIQVPCTTDDLRSLVKKMIIENNN